MAQIVWRKSATILLEAHFDYALKEFGQKCVSNWYHDILKVETRLKLQPLSYPKIEILQNRGKDYRGATIMSNFLLIYFYDSSQNIVYIDTIWDMRMNPNKLRYIEIK